MVAPCVALGFIRVVVNEIELNQAEATQLAEVDAQAEKSKQSIREYFANARRGLFNPLAAFQTSKVKLEKETVEPEPPRPVTFKTRELIDLVKAEILAYPSMQFTFPQIKASLERKGHRLSRNQFRPAMQAIAGKAPAFEVTPRSGSVAGVYSKIPVVETVSSSLETRLDFHSQNGHALEN